MATRQQLADERGFDTKPRVGISRCLLGDPVRYDGGHERSAILLDELGPLVEWVPVCPELELGMGVPRPPIRLEQPAGTEGEASRRLVERESGRAHTDRMRAYAAQRARVLSDARLCGFVFKQDSPSCGIEAVKVWRENGMPVREGRGLFAAALMSHDPLLPVEEEARLLDAALRERFVERVFTYARHLACR